VREAQELMLAIQNSKLAHSGLQICCDGETRARVDTLFEGTEEGCTAQTVQMKFMMSDATLGDAGSEVWNAREEICSVGADDSDGNFAVAKICLLPAQIADGVDRIREFAVERVRWRVVFEATGIGWMRLDGTSAEIRAALIPLREWVEERGGSLVILRRALGMSEMDAWGASRDGLELMRAVKRQFDPMGTLNRGRFVDGI
jgi:hypothetical protein